MREVAVITVGRSDYGIYRPILKQIEKDPELRLNIIAAGMHLSDRFGKTVNVIEQEGFTVADRVELPLESDTPQSISKSIGIGTIGFGQIFSKHQPDILLILGDRVEMLAAASAALPFNIPIAHIHGGEITEGAIDDAVRHCITKMAHLHFGSTEDHCRRIRQMGEEKWRVTMCGAPGLDNIINFPSIPQSELESIYGFNLEQPPLLVTFHPVTLELRNVSNQINALISALKITDIPVVFTYPNADSTNLTIVNAIERFVQNNDNAWLIVNLGTDAYFSLMQKAIAMVGKSSSGIIEAASFGLPVVNIGTRQDGRVHPPNVIDVNPDKESILDGIRCAISSGFKKSIASLENPYGNGHAAKLIVTTLKNSPLGDKLLRKRFQDLIELDHIDIPNGVR